MPRKDCTCYVWGQDSIVVGRLYRFLKQGLIKASSVRLDKKTFAKKDFKAIHINGESKTRQFERGRLVDEHNDGYLFTGHKVPDEGHQKSNNKYLFSLPSN